MVRNCFGLKIISVLWQITCKDKSLLLFSKSRTEAMTWFRSIRDAIRWGAKITIALPRGPNPHWKWTCKNYALLIGWKRVYFHVTRVQSCSTRANFKERAHAFKMSSVLTFLRARAILLSLKNLLVRAPNCTRNHVITYTNSPFSYDHPWAIIFGNSNAFRLRVIKPKLQ